MTRSQLGPLLTIQVRGRPGKGERAFAVIALFFYSGALVPLLRQIGGFQFDVATGDIVSQLIFLTIEVITFMLLLPHWRRVLSVATRNVPLLLLIVFAVVSIYWSQDFDVSFRRGAALLGSTLMGV